LPLNRVGSLSKINKTFAELEQKFQREPSTEEIAEVIGVTVEDVLENLKVAGRHVSMDAPFVTGEENSLNDVLFDANESEPDSALMSDSLVMEVQRALGTLTQREAEVLGLYFGLNNNHSMSLEEIAERYSLTRESVRQIKEKATRRLRHSSRSRTLKTYLG
jgi:RNA polymerase primary sigma factor